MSGRRIVFVDRDGTLVREPADCQVDRIDKIALLPDVIPSLLRLKSLGFAFVMVTNQDGLGTASFPHPAFQAAHDFMVGLFASQGLEFERTFICPHFESDACACRKPNPGLVSAWLASIDLDYAHSYMIGDRETDLTFAANLGITGLQVRADDAAATWPAVANRIAAELRRSRYSRNTRETQITVEVSLDSSPAPKVDCGVHFLNHMLEQVATHGGFGLDLQCRGDLHIDEHHTVEDCAIALGSALRAALGDKRGVGRYGFVLPMDESLAQVALDLSGRSFFVWDGNFTRERIGDLPTELVPHFFRTLAENLGAALHIQVRGENTHHMVEACFKGVGRALRQAIRVADETLPSTKGAL